ncbi:uncharacterized protein LOC124533189 [Vanessa cardui]|uniref:uncharacterized protein LOC124533189 n=1 Tax=Vanessa cardui TaxID=171605 RepID=UPI001F12E15C|nr:uncharacterized protein LOC124533189 [Vanessa cardui]
MDVSVEEFVDRLLSDEAYQEPSDSVKVEEVEMQMRFPEWFDEKKYNQGRRFYQDFSFGFSVANILGLVAVYSVPTIAAVLAGSRRSNSPYTAYKRYSATFMHFNAWVKNDLKPGTVAWKSLQTVRSRHVQAGRAARLKGKGTISQRDVALTLFTLFGFAIVKPDKFSIRQREEGDWEALIHYWRVIGHMLGLQDRYNICRETYEETRQIFQRIVDKVFTPCLENVPEYFEHLTHVTVDGLQAITSGLEKSSLIYWTKYMADVPGYIYTEGERIALQDKLRAHLKGKSPDTGVESRALIEKNVIGGLPDIPSQTLYLRDFNSLETAPAYKALPFIGRYSLAILNLMFAFYSTWIGRVLLNFQNRWTQFLSTYLPYVAMWRFGLKNAFVNMFKESPIDNTIPKPNSEYYRPQPPEPWYKTILAIIW